MYEHVSLKKPARFSLALRIALALFVLLASIAVTFTLLRNAKAAPAEISMPGSNPWGIAFGGNGTAWVALPNCDPTPVCTASGNNGSLVAISSGGNVTNYSVPMQTGYSSPVFVAVGGNNTIWFTMPKANALGRFIPPSNWSYFPAPTAAAAPFNLTIDKSGNVWFTEVSANKIGVLNTSNGQISETATPTANSKPYGIVGPDPNSGAIWFTENQSSVAKVGSFMPTAPGGLTTSGIHEYQLTVNGSNTPHLITYDARGNIWVSGGFDRALYRLTISQVVDGTANGITRIAVPAGSGSSHISGIGADGNGTIWFDDSLGDRVMSMDTAGQFATTTLAANAHPHDGLAVDGQGTVFFSEEFANKVGKITQSGVPPVPTPTTPAPTPTPGSTPPPSTGNAPVSNTWYFAEGRVGKGFREYITLENPAKSSCAVTLRYLYSLDGNATPRSKNVTVMVPAASRVTQAVHSDLGIDWNTASAASLATIVTTGGCGVVAERPIYFVNYHAISSGTNVLGLTHLNTTFYFADVPTDAHTSTFLSILNPNGGAASVTANYYLNGKKVGTHSVTVPANARGTLSPNGLGLPAHVAAVVTASAPVMVERPSYFSNVNGISGAADVVGAQGLATDWLFAEGYTGSGYQEKLSIANLDPANKPAAVTVTLKSQSGATRNIPLTLAASSQVILNINAENAFAGSTPEVSLEVKSSGAAIVAQRQLFFFYQHTINGNTTRAMGATDVIGQPGPASKSSYTFAEGYSNLGYNEWLTLQNPTGSDQTITVTLVNGKGITLTRSYLVKANTRSTVDISALVRQAPLAHPGDNHLSYEVAMVVQSAGNVPFVVERPMYWNTGGVSSFVTQGGSDIIGFAG